MKKIRNLREKIIIFAGILLLIAGISMLIWINFMKQNYSLHNDSAAELALSKLLSEEGGILSRNWYYSTELRILNTQLVYTPLFHIFENWATVRALGNLILYFIMIISYIFFTRQLSIKRHLIIFTLPFLLFMPSGTFLDMIGVDTFYIPHIVMGFCYIGIYLKYFSIKSKDRIKQLFCIIVYLLLSFLCGMSGTRYLMNIQAPLLLAGILFFCLSNERKALRYNFTLSNFNNAVKSGSAKRAIVSIAGIVVAMTGYFVNTKVLQQIYSFQNYSDKTFRAIDSEFISDIGFVINGFLSLMGYRANVKFFSLAGLCNICILLFFIIVFYIIVRNLLNRQNSLTDAQLLTILFFLSSLFISIFLTLMTKELVNRYYIPVIIFYIPIVAIYLNKQDEYISDKIFCSSALLYILLLTTFITVSTYSKKDSSADKQGATNFLVENNYTFGWATFWNADVFTYLSNGLFEVAHIYEPQSMTAFKWLSPKKYYESGYYSGQVFLLLSESERLKFQNAPVILEGVQVYQDAYYTIYIYASSVLDKYLQL